MPAIELEPHVQSIGRGMSYLANHAQKHKNAPESHHEPSFIIIYRTDYTSTVLRAFLCTPNKESSCAEFGPCFWNTLYVQSYFSQHICLSPIWRIIAIMLDVNLTQTRNNK
ncbi:hypothetical protein TNCV_2847041 [Trichonephila clavipes]|nr:hypothetical protein TNCV_2847041 [Trichonephila clavipes]